jgi:uncharacterized protein with HEPN domain
LSNKNEMLCLNILEACKKIERISKGFKTFQEFENDPISFDATLMNFVVIGEMANKLRVDFRELNPTIEWRKIIGFRNFIAHDYFGIDAEEVWEIINTDIPVLLKSISDLIPQ